MDGLTVGLAAAGSKGAILRGYERVGTFGEWDARQTMDGDWRVVVSDLDLDEVWGHATGCRLLLQIGKKGVELPIIARHVGPSVTSGIFIARGEPKAREFAGEA